MPYFGNTPEKKVVQFVLPGAADPEPVSHDLGTQDVAVSVRRTSDNKIFDSTSLGNVIATDANTVSIPTTNLPSDTYEVTCIG